MSFTAHWLAVEGVQPTTPQNPSSAPRGVELAPKSQLNPALTALSGDSSANITTKPLVKHHLSQELILYFERVCSSALQEDSPELRQAALSSLRDEHISQLLPYFTQFLAEKVTHDSVSLFTLQSVLGIADSLTHNPHLNAAPYAHALVPPILTCLLGRQLGPAANTEHFGVRLMAASVLAHICRKYSRSAHGLKPRLARSCLKTFLDPKKPLGAHYGAIAGLRAIGGPEVVRKLIVPNLKAYEEVLRDAMSEGGRSVEVEEVVKAIVEALGSLVQDEPSADAAMVNGHVNGDAGALRGRLEEKIGGLLAERVLAGSGGGGGELGEKLAKAVLDDGFEDL
jgi:transcription initiation factor TFIID subunit 6